MRYNRKIPFKVSTLDTALKLIEILKLRGAKDRIELAFRYFPECFKMTHSQLAEVVNMDRVTVTKTISKLRRYL